MSAAHTRPRRRRIPAAIAALALTGMLALGGFAQAESDPAKDPVRVMSRNLYLGADLGPAIASPDFPTFVKRAGDVYNNVQATNFPVRAQALAQEIQDKQIDLVGMQEVAWWRTQSPPDGPPSAGGTAATTTAYDFLQSMLSELNKNAKTKKQCKKQAQDGRCYRGYRVVVSQDEFDFETIANTSGTVNPNPPLFGATMDVRLTMRDVILARKGAGVETENPRGANFSTLLTVPTVVGPITVKRGWVDTDASVRGRNFHFVNTHLEAFDSQPPQFRGRIREAQAKELVAPGGPATSETRPVVLVGDMNSHVPGVQPGDELAFQALLDAGFTTRSPVPPDTCCYQSELLNNPNDFLDHTVDHVLSNSESVTRVDSGITGTAMYQGLWPSDHAGVFSFLSLPRED
jgi:endonuclease/exonuclease/phosphatase family metal-dependent hydrolase